MHLYIYIYNGYVFLLEQHQSCTHGRFQVFGRTQFGTKFHPQNMKPDAGASPMMYLQYLHVSSIRTRFCSEYLQRLNSFEPCAKCGNPAHGI